MNPTIARNNQAVERDNTILHNHNNMNKQNRHENDNQEELFFESSTNSMDVSTSLTPNNQLFTSPPKLTITKKDTNRQKTPAQKRRQRRYNLRKFKNTKKHSTLIKPKLNRKPIIQMSTLSVSNPNTEQITQSNHTTQQHSRNNKKPENNKYSNTVRVVDFITDSKDINNNQDIKGLIVTSEPTHTFTPNYTLNYVTINSNLIQRFIHNKDINETYLINRHMMVDDTILHVNEILFRFTETETEKNWYYCHYIDLDYHGNVILLDETDTPHELIHRFNIKHDIAPRTLNQCTTCTRNKNNDDKFIGFFAPCYLHKSKHNRAHYHTDDQRSSIKLIQKICHRHNQQQQQLVHNPIIHTETIDKKHDLKCSTILPTNNGHLGIKTIQFRTTDESDIIFGLKMHIMKLPESIQCNSCQNIHQRTIAYDVYDAGFICDRCGYGYNAFDMIYRCDKKVNQNQKECEEMDLCCRCAIDILNTREQDMDFNTTSNLTQHMDGNNVFKRINVPMINTRYVHQGKKIKTKKPCKPTVNYSLQKQDAIRK